MPTTQRYAVKKKPTLIQHLQRFSSKLDGSGKRDRAPGLYTERQMQIPLKSVRPPAANIHMNPRSKSYRCCRIYRYRHPLPEHFAQ